MPNNEGITFVLKVRDDGTAVISKFSGSLKKVDEALDNATKNQRKWREEAERSAKSSNVLADSVKLLVTAFVSYKAVSWAKDTALLASRYETLGVVLETVGRNIGMNRAKLEELEKGLQKTGISMIQSRQNIIRMIQANIDLSQAYKLARVAQDAAVIGNVNSSEAFSRLIYGIQSAQIEVLRTIGINVNFENSYAKAAKTLGKTAQELNEVEKANIRMNTVLQAGVNIAGSYDAAMNTAGKQLLSWERYLEDARVTLGQAFAPATNEIIMSMVKNTKDLANIFKDPSFQEAILGIAEAIGALAKSTAEATGYVGKFIKGYGNFKEAQQLGKTPEELKSMDFVHMPLEQQKKILEDLKRFQQSSDIEAFASAEQFIQKNKEVVAQVKTGIEDTKQSLMDFADVQKKVDTQLNKFFGDLDKREKEIGKTLEKDIDQGLWWFDELDAREKRYGEFIKTIEEFDKSHALDDISGQFALQGIDFDPIRDHFKKTSDDMIKLSQYTAEAMQRNFSDFFFDAFTGKLTTLSDYLNSFLQSVQRALANYMGQQVTQGLFGKDFQGGGLITQIGQYIGSARGNILAGPGIAMFENQIVSSPKVFGFAQGIGIIGEGTKPEGVLPLARTSSGDLGVQTVGGAAGMPKVEINVYNQSGQEVKKSKVQTRFDAQGFILDVVLDGANRNVDGFADALGLRRG